MLATRSTWPFPRRIAGPVNTVLLCMHASVPPPAYRHTCSGGAVAKCVPSRCSERAAAGRRAGRRRRRRGIDKWPRVCLSGNTTKHMFGAMSSGTWSPSWPKALRPLNYRALFRTLELACASAVAQTYFYLFVYFCLFVYFWRSSV